MTPWYGVVLEVKNIGGVLEFKDNPPQLIRIRDDGHKDGFESPVVQLERNCECLTDWLRSRNIDLPIYGAIVLAYPKQIVACSPAKTKLLYPYLIPSFIKSIPRQIKKLDNEAFNWLSAEILNSHQRFIPKPICETYSLPFRDFHTGVRCDACGRFGMIKLRRTWYCPFARRRIISLIKKLCWSGFWFLRGVLRIWNVESFYMLMTFTPPIEFWRVWTFLVKEHFVTIHIKWTLIYGNNLSLT